MDLIARIDAHVGDIESRINAIQSQFDEPVRPNFQAVFTTTEAQSLPLAPPAPDTPFPSSSSTPPAFGEIIQEASTQFGIDPSLLQAVIHQESGENPNARSGVGAMGLMQLMPNTAKTLGVNDPYNPRENVFGGAKYLRQLMDQFGGNTALALAAYNAGPNAVKKNGGQIPPYHETRNYVRNIMDMYNNLRNGGQLK